jgi:hypothetical protein
MKKDQGDRHGPVPVLLLADTFLILRRIYHPFQAFSQGEKFTAEIPAAPFWYKKYINEYK